MRKSNIHARDWIAPVLRSSCNSHGSLDGEIHRKGNGNRKPGAAVRGGARRTYIHSLNLVPGRWLILDLTRQPWRNCYTLFLDHGWKRRGRLSPLCSIPRDETRHNAFHEKATDAGHLAKFEIILRKKLRIPLVLHECFTTRRTEKTNEEEKIYRLHKNAVVLFDDLFSLV